MIAGPATVGLEICEQVRAAGRGARAGERRRPRVGRRGRGQGARAVGADHRRAARRHARRSRPARTARRRAARDGPPPGTIADALTAPAIGELNLRVCERARRRGRAPERGGDRARACASSTRARSSPASRARRSASAPCSRGASPTGRRPVVAVVSGGNITPDARGGDPRRELTRAGRTNAARGCCVRTERRRR